MITKKQVLNGIEKGAVKFIASPDDGKGTVCSIGDYWFSFGDNRAASMLPKEYLSKTKIQNIATDITNVLSELEHSGDFALWLYFDAVLCNVDKVMYAAVGWMTDDIIEIAKGYGVNLSEHDAQKWLTEHEETLRANMKRAGLTVINQMLKVENKSSA